MDTFSSDELLVFTSSNCQDTFVDFNYWLLSISDYFPIDFDITLAKKPKIPKTIIVPKVNIKTTKDVVFWKPDKSSYFKGSIKFNWNWTNSVQVTDPTL